LSTEALKVLVTTRLFPNAADPLAAAFNRQQFTALSRLCSVELLAVIPWFPGARLFSRWSAAGRLLDVPAHEQIGELPVHHPRVFYLPRLGHALAPALYTASLLPWVGRLRGKVDVVLGSWAFPDGVAAVSMARLLGVPAVVKLHGSDMNVLADLPPARRLLQGALPRADRVVAVSRGLADKARELGVPEHKIVLVPNGVDRELFHPQDRSAARQALGLAAYGDRPLILYVGRLERAKGTVELLTAFQRLAGTRPEPVLALVGEGSDGERCREAARALPGRVLIPGPHPLAEVARWMAACDLLVLPSWNEGTPNVLLEALASGRRVVATRVGGIPDVIHSPVLGELVPARDDAALAEAIGRTLDVPYDPAAVAAGAPGGWDTSAARLHEVLLAAARRMPAAAAPAVAA
jgi:glycosyltransferase involved in cell wall biosynthesis